MINSVWLWGEDKDRLREILERDPQLVDIIGTAVRSGVKYSGLASDIPYGETIMVSYKGKTYGFKKRTDGVITVL